METATTRRTVFGRVLGESERISVLEALRCYTTRAAAALGVERARGLLEARKLADLVVLDRDPFAVAPDELAETRPLATMLGGRWAFDAR